MDVLDDILGSLRLNGGVVIDGEFTGDFCVMATFTPGHFAPFFPTPETLISYHYVRTGQMIVEVDGMAPVTLNAGDIAILPRNDPHKLASRSGLPPADAGKVSRITADGVHRVTTGSAGPMNEVWCGFLGTAKSSAHPLLDALPPLLTLTAGGGEAEWLDSSMRFLAEEQPSSEVVARLAELFLAQAIREYVDHLPPGADGWLRGLTDPAVSRALSIIHNRYGEDLDIEGLARESGVSRSVLGERFVELLGEPPMRYCARWRMRVAANMLRDGKESTATAAYAVGFNSEAAFNRAFKREYGEPPGTWRRRVDAETSPPDGSRLAADQVSSCTGRDGARIAFAMCGDGFPIVKAPSAVTHIEHDRSSPIHAHWLTELARTNRLVRSDMRGFGLSEWEPEEYSFDAIVADLAAVIDAAGVEQCDLVGLAHGAAIAIAYAARHPERVRKLVLVNSFAAGWAVRGDPDEIAWRKSLSELNRRRWSREGVALGEQFVTLYFPSAAAEMVEWHKQRFDQLCTAESIERMLKMGARIDVREEVGRVRAPTLVFHSSKDGNATKEVGKAVADAIPGARFVELDSANHFILGDEPAWPALVTEMRAFLAA